MENPAVGRSIFSLKAAPDNGGKLGFAMSLRLTPELKEALLKANETGLVPSFRLAEGTSGVAIDVGDQRFDLKSLPIQNVLECYEERSLGDLYRVGIVKTKLTVSRDLTKQDAARIKKKVEEAERKAKEHKSKELDRNDLGPAADGRRQGPVKVEKRTTVKVEKKDDAGARAGTKSAAGPPPSASTPAAALDAVSNIDLVPDKPSLAPKPTARGKSDKGTGASGEKRPSSSQVDPGVLRIALIEILAEKPLSRKAIERALAERGRKMVPPRDQLVRALKAIADYRAPDQYKLHPEASRELSLARPRAHEGAAMPAGMDKAALEESPEKHGEAKKQPKKGKKNGNAEVKQENGLRPLILKVGKRDREPGGAGGAELVDKEEEKDKKKLRETPPAIAVKMSVKVEWQDQLQPVRSDAPAQQASAAKEAAAQAPVAPAAVPPSAAKGSELTYGGATSGALETINKVRDGGMEARKPSPTRKAADPGATFSHRTQVPENGSMLRREVEGALDTAASFDDEDDSGWMPYLTSSAFRGSVDSESEFQECVSEFERRFAVYSTVCDRLERNAREFLELNDRLREAAGLANSEESADQRKRLVRRMNLLYARRSERVTNMKRVKEKLERELQPMKKQIRDYIRRHDSASNGKPS